MNSFISLKIISVSHFYMIFYCGQLTIVHAAFLFTFVLISKLLRINVIPQNGQETKIVLLKKIQISKLDLSPH